MDADARPRRMRFYAAMVLFAGWILVLGALGMMSGQDPPRGPNSPPAVGTGDEVDRVEEP